MSLHKAICRTLTGVGMVSAFFLIACGDDGSSAGDTDGNRGAVGSLYELGKCSSANSGERIFVENENSYYECSNVCSGNGRLGGMAGFDYTALEDPADAPGGNESDVSTCYDWVSESTNDNSGSKNPSAKSSSSVIDQTNYYSSATESNYGNEEEAFLYKEFFVEIDLTLFKQVSDNWENQNKNKGNYSDGDPRISFVIKTYSDDELKDSVKTDVFKLDDNVGKWTGHQFFTKNFSGGANSVYICPQVYEHNSVQSDVFKSSGYCYIVRDAGNKVNTPIKQNDSYATDCELEWTVTINYK